MEAPAPAFEAKPRKSSFAKSLSKLSRKASRTFQNASSMGGRKATVLDPVDAGEWEEDADLQAESMTTRAKGAFALVALAFQAIGVVYGDISTSPIYVWGSVFNNVPSEDDIVGALSLIIWTLTALVPIKYALIVLRADDNGQGGTFALYSLLKRAGDRRHMGLYSKQPAAQETEQSQQLEYSELHPVGMAKQAAPTTTDVVDWRTKLARNKRYKQIIRVLVILGVGAIMGDGVLTPAISVISSMEGINVSFPGVSRNWIVGASLGILFILFNIQRYGTKLLGLLFSPVVTCWLIFNGIIGLYNLAKYNPAVLRAFAPNYWFTYFLRNGTTGWRSLGGVLLCVTGCEALFADMGHFSRQSIQLSTFTLVWPSLLLTYAGEAAYLTKHPEDYTEAYFRSVPRSLYWPMWIIAIAASIIASQALIAAVGSIVFQAIAQGFFPRFHVYHTSDHVFGQVYIPFINYMLMVLTLIVVGTFKTSASLGQAYGLAVIWDMLLTSHFVTLVIITVWRLPVIFALGYFLIFATVEATYLSSAVVKIPTGAWFTVVLACIYAFIMGLWFWGMTNKNNFFLRRYFLRFRTLETMLVSLPAKASGGSHADLDIAGTKEPSNQERLVLVDGNKPVEIQKGICLYYSETVYGVPPVLVQHLTMFPMLHEINIIITNRNVAVPEVYQHERFLIEQLGITGFYQCIVRYGYTENVSQGTDFVQAVIHHVLNLLYQNLERVVDQFPELKDESAQIDACGMASGVDPDSAIDLVELPKLARVSSKRAGVTLREANSRKLPDPSPGLGAPPAFRARASGNKLLSPFAGTVVQVATQVQRNAAGDFNAIGSLSHKSMDPLQAEAVSNLVEHINNGQLQCLRRRNPAVLRANLVAKEISILERQLSLNTGVTYVMGRAHMSFSSTPGLLAWLRRMFLEFPYHLFVLNTKSDAYRKFNIPEGNLVQVGLPYEV